MEKYHLLLIMRMENGERFPWKANLASCALTTQVPFALRTPRLALYLEHISNSVKLGMPVLYDTA